MLYEKNLNPEARLRASEILARYRGDQEADEKKQERGGGQNNARLVRDSKKKDDQDTVTGLKTGSGYYARPDFWSRSDELRSSAEALESETRKKASVMYSAKWAEAEALGKVQIVKKYLKKAGDMYNSNPTESNAALYNEVARTYEQVYEPYRVANEVYNQAYAEYQPVAEQYAAAYGALDQYTKEQQAAFEDWKGTIRDASTIKREIEGMDAQIEALEKQLTGYAVNSTLAAQGRIPGSGLGEDPRPKIDQLQQMRDLLQEEYDWSQYYRYADLQQAADFGEKSKYVSTANGLEPVLNNWSGMYTETGFDDLTYDYINRNQEAQGKALVNSIGDNTALLGLDKSYLKKMTDEEISIFNYLYATQGADAAYQYTAYLTGDLTRRQRMEQEAEWAAWAKENPVKSSIFSVLTAPMKGISYLGQAADMFADGKIDQNAAYNKFSYIPGSIRSEVEQQIEASGKWGKVGSFTYQTGLSMADFLFTTTLTGGNQPLSLAIMGTGAAADTTIAAKDRGLEDWQAFTLGTVAGLAEVITEKFSVETLLNPRLLKDGVWKYMKKNMITEGLEEGASDLINLFFDCMISKEQSEWRQSIDAYVEAGMTEKQALLKAIGDQIITVGLDMLGGALSGGIMSGGNAVIQNNRNKQLAKQLDLNSFDENDIKDLIDSGLESDHNTESYQLAVQLQKKLDAGKKLSGDDLSRLLQANEQAMQAEREGGPLESAPGFTVESGDHTQESELESVRLRGVDDDTQTPAFVTQNPQNGTQTQVNDTSVPGGAPISVAERMRQEQTRNGGTQYEDEQPEGLQLGAAFADDTTGAGISDGVQVRNAGQGTAEQVGVLASSPEQRRSAYADRSRATVARQNYARSLRLEKVSSLDLGLQSGTEARNIQVIPQEHWNNEMSQLADRIYNETGKSVTYVMGRIQIRGNSGAVGYAKGVITGDRIIVQADHLRLPMEQIADHEAYHAKADWVRRNGTDLNAEIRRHIVETFSEEEFQQVLDKYIVGLRGVIDVNEAKSAEEFESVVRQIEEEIFADAYAGINAFGANADQFTGAVNERMDQLYIGKTRNQDNGTEDPTGPPNERYSIGHTTDNRPFVTVERDILAGVPQQDWVRTVKQNLKQKFPSGIIVGNNEIRIDKRSREEMTYSGYMRWLQNNDPQAYQDKLRATDNADEILLAATNWINESPNHARKDKIVDFASGKVLIRIGNNDYSAKVVVGTETNGHMRLYDILDLRPTKFTEKETAAAIAANPSPGVGRNATTVSGQSVPQESKTVKERFSYAGENANDTEPEGLRLGAAFESADSTQVKSTDNAGAFDNVSTSYEGRSLVDDPDVYSYDFLTVQSPMKTVKLPQVSDVRNANGKVNTAKVLSNGMKNALSAGTEKDGKIYVQNRYTGRELWVTSAAIRHGLNGASNRLLTNARLGSIIGEIVQNAIPINALHNTADGVEGTYAMAGYAFDQQGREFVAIVTVEQRTDTVADITAYDMTHAISGRQKRGKQEGISPSVLASNEGSQADTKSQGVNPIKASSEINIADLLEAVKEVYQSILSEDVLEHLGETRNPKGHYSDRVRYSYAEEDSDSGNDVRGLNLPTLGEEGSETKNGALPFKTGTREGYPGGDTPSDLSILERIRSVKNETGTRERFSLDDDATAMERELDRLKSPTYQDELARSGGSAALARNQKRIEDLEWQIKRDPETYDRRKERELQTEGKVAAKANVPSHRELERERQEWLQREYDEKAKKLENKPTISKREFRNTLMNIFSIPEGSRTELGTMIDNYADRLIKNGSLTEEDRKAFFDRMYDAGVMVMPADEYKQFARSHIADGRIYVSDSVKSDFGGDWADIRRRAFAAGVYLVNDRSAPGIDQWNTTLSAEDMLPGLFDSEETDERTILERIVQVAEEGKDEHLSLAEYTKMLAGQEYVSESEFLDSMERQMDWALRTFAEKADLEVKLRDRADRRVKTEKGKANERVANYAYKDAQRRAKEREARMEMRQRQRDRKVLQELQQRTLKQLQWLSKNRNRAPEELQATWDEVLGDIDLYAISAADEMRWSDKHNATWKDLAQMYKDAMKNDPNFLPSKELERIVTRLDATKIADMDLGALQDLYKAAIGLRTEFYNRNNVINDEMQRLFAEVYTDAKREIESAPGGFTGGVADKFLNLDQLTPMNVLQRMAGWDPDGAFYSMAKQLERGERDMRAYSVKAQKMLQDFLTEHEDWVKKADGQGKDAIWYEVEVPQLLELGMGDKPIFGPTVKVYMTPAQKVHMYLESKNLDNLRHMTGGRTFVNKDLYSQGKRQEALSQGRTIKLAPETVRKLVSDLSPEEMELAQILDRYYNTFATQEINKVSNILYGYDKAMGKNYAPIYTNRNYTKTEFGVFDTTAEGVGNLKGRQYAVNPSYNISAFDAFERHVDQTARFCGMAIPARNWTTLMNWREKNNSTGDVITHKWGEESKRYITDLITTLQAGDDAKSDTISSGLSKLQSNYITAIFGANPSIVLKQLGSIPLAGAYLDARNMPTPAQISKIDRSLISKYTQELEWRTMGYATPETKQLKDNPNWTQTNKAFKFVFGGGAITAMDGWAASTLWPWAENKVRREHPELTVGTKAQIDAGESAFYKKVAEEFENAISRSQSVSDEIHQGTLRKSKNPITKAFTMFRSDSAQTYNALRQKIGEARYYMRTGAKEKVIQTAKKAAGTAFVAMLLNAAWSEAVSFLMALWKNKGKYYRDDEDELTFLSVAGEMVSNVFGSLAGVVTGGEEVFELIGNIITGDTWYGIETPGMEQLNDLLDTLIESGSGMRDFVAGGWDVVKNGGNLGDYFSKHSGEMLGGIKDLAKAAAMYLSGMPASNLEAYLTGAMKWISPELGAAYDDLFAETGKSDLAGMEGDALEGRVGRILSDRNVSESDDTAAALAALYEAGYKTAIPSDTPTSVSIDGEKHSLGEYQQQAYDTIWGGIVADALDDMVASDSFKEADPKTQAKMLSNLYTYAAEQAKAELFDEYELDSGATKNAAIVAAGATVAECITWNTITSEMKSGEKSAELVSWDIPEEAKREIFRCKISDSREDSIAAFDEAGLSFDQFLQAYSMYGQINNEDLKAGMKAVEFSHWVNAQGYTAEQAAVVKDELTYFNMTPASSSRYDELVGAGMDPDEAYDLTGALNELQPEDGADEVSDLQKWRASVDFSDDVDDQLAALSAVMEPAQFLKVEIANNFGISPDAYVTLQEIKPRFDADGNGSYKNAEIQAAVDGLPGYYTTEQKAVLWQLATGSTSSGNNPYSRKVGQQVLDAKAAAKEAAEEEEELEGLTLGNW